MKYLLKNVEPPKKDCPSVQVELTETTIKHRLSKVLEQMEELNLDRLIIYGDVEHGGNFEYLMGFFTRFEEALLVIDRQGEMTAILGNENYNKASKARLKVKALHASLFSLPNQPQRMDMTLSQLLQEAGISEGLCVGLAGWKLFTSAIENNDELFEVPSYLVDAIKRLLGETGRLSNQTKLFIGECGVRTTNNANEMAHYEYGAALASDCVLDTMDILDVGVEEKQLGDRLVRYGQHTSIITIAASGERYINANMFPRDNQVNLGDAISLTVGYRGGSSSRCGYAAMGEHDLPEACRDYVDQMSGPYFVAYCRWLECLHPGMTGGAVYSAIEEILPKKEYGWFLCPGHLTAEEEWMSSPIYEGSKEVIQSGMMFQIDIIPSKKGYAGASAESTVALADQNLQEEIRREYPQMWSRIEARREYMSQVLGVKLSPEILPLCSTVAYLRPYLLQKNLVFVLNGEGGNE